MTSNGGETTNEGSLDKDDQEKHVVPEPGGTPSPLKTIDMSLLHELTFILLDCVSQFTTQVSVGQTIAIVYDIGDSFGIANPGELSWFMASFSLTVGTFNLPSGLWGDLFGY